MVWIVQGALVASESLRLSFQERGMGGSAGIVISYSADLFVIKPCLMLKPALSLNLSCSFRLLGGVRIAYSSSITLPLSCSGVDLNSLGDSVEWVL